MEQRASQTRPCVQLVRAYDADTWCTGIEQSIYSHPGISRRCVLSHSVPHFDTYRLPFKILPATLPVWDFRVAPMGGRRPSFGPVHRSPLRQHETAVGLARGLRFGWSSRNSSKSFPTFGINGTFVSFLFVSLQSLPTSTPAATRATLYYIHDKNAGPRRFTRDNVKRTGRNAGNRAGMLGFFRQAETRVRERQFRPKLPARGRGGEGGNRRCSADLSALTPLGLFFTVSTLDPWVSPF